MLLDHMERTESQLHHSCLLDIANFLGGSDKLIEVYAKARITNVDSNKVIN